MPKTTKFGPKLAFLFIAGSFGALLVGCLVVVAQAVSRKTPIYFIDNLVQFEEDFISQTKKSVWWIGYLRLNQFLEHLTVLNISYLNKTYLIHQFYREDNSRRTLTLNPQLTSK